MLIQALKELRLNLEDIKSILSKEFTNAKIVSSTAEGVTYIAVQTLTGKLIFDIRLTDNLVELYVNLEEEFRNDTLRSIAKLGLEAISREINQLIESLNSTPKSLILSRVLPSKSIYILLESRGDFPPVKGVLSPGGLTIITPTCAVHDTEAACNNPRDTTIVKAVIEVLRILSLMVSEGK